MSISDHLTSAPSPELVALCQSQLRLLQQGLQVDWGAVYLRGGFGGLGPQTTWAESELATDLIPVAVYPRPEVRSDRLAGFITLPQGETLAEYLPLPMGDDHGPVAHLSLFSGVMAPLASTAAESSPEQLVFPLLYQEMMLGVLVTCRHSPDWQPQELQQLEAAAHSLAIACVLDQRQHWYHSQLLKHQSQQQWERDRWDDLLHQLRNPLTALKTFSKLLFKRLAGDDKTQGLAQSIMREGEHLQELLASFESEIHEPRPVHDPGTWETDLAPESPPGFLLPSAQLTLVSMPLATVLETVLVAEQAIAAERQIRLQVQLSEPSPLIQAHPPSLREVLSNVLDNAVKYTPNHGLVSITPVLHPSEPERWQGLAIADSGCGIPLADQGHIFERHYRGQQSQGSIPGNGLGLAIVKELMERMQGKIEIHSPNQTSVDPRYPGTTVILWFLRGDPCP